VFSSEADYITFLSADNKDKNIITKAISVHQWQLYCLVFHYSLHPSIKNLYYKGKGYELLSLYFNRTEDPNAEQMFLIDEDNVIKKKSKEIIIANMAEPPGLQELADEIGLNLKKKNGFQTNLWGYRLWIFYLITKWILLENYSTAVPIM
jgi:hypothetical protein